MVIRLLFIFVYLFSFFSYSQEWKKDIVDARKYYNEKKFKESSDKYSKIEKKLPNSFDFKQELAQNYYRCENYKSAKKKYSTSIDLAKSTNEKALSYYNLGNTYLKQQKYPEAIESFKQSLRLNSKDDECRFNLAKALQQQNQQNQQQSNSKNKQSKEKNDNNSNKSKQDLDKQSEQQKADRMLDELRKKESETKKKSLQNREGNKANSSTNKNIKDW